jgi:hypothetical protein
MKIKRALIGAIALCAAALLAPTLLGVTAQSSEQAPLATATPEPGVLRSYRAARPPAIDGSLADWPVQGSILLNRSTASHRTGVITSDADASVTCRSMWDENTLYVGCDVSDDALVADSDAEVWKDDAVELAFDGKNDDISFCGASFCPDDHKYELRVNGTVTDDAKPPNPPVSSAMAGRPGGYRVEIAIPRANFDAGDFAPGKALGFNLGLIDDDNGGETDGHLFWMGQSTWNHADDYGYLILDAQSFAPPGSTSTPTPTRTHTPTPTATLTPFLDLSAATPIVCSQSLSGDTRLGVNLVNSYGCVPFWPQPGPEQLYVLDLTETTDLDVVLSDTSVDLDLFLLTGASPATCISYGDTFLNGRDLAPGAYYIVVDGYEGTAGAYRIQVWCPLDQATELTPTPTPTATPTSTPTLGAPHLYFPLLLRG